MFFTRLPLWRIHQPPQEHFRHVVHYWPFVGWLTGGAMALFFVLTAQMLPLSLALLLTIGGRILLTGALHEDGLADFCDGMGGGHTRERTLAIMKDSHIGTYGVLGLILYLLVLYHALHTLALGSGEHLLVAAFLLTTDVWSKACASLLVGHLSYARPVQEVKSQVVYERLSWGAQALRTLLALLPVGAVWFVVGFPPPLPVFLIPLLIEGGLALWLHQRLGGYTGDCCGATVLLCEVGMYLTWIICL